MAAPDLNKLLKRGWMIFQAFLKNYSSPLFNAILAWVVIRNYSSDLWGDFVKVQLFVTLGSQFCNWSSKTQLLRSFSTSPSTMHQVWRTAYSERIPLLLVVCPLAFVFIDGSSLVGLSIIWLIARYIILSYEPVIIFQRKYFIGILADLLSFIIALLAVLLKDDLTVEVIVGIIALAEICEAVVLIWLFRRSFKALRPSSLTGKFLKDSSWLFLLAFSAFAGMRADLLCAAFFLSKSELAFYQVFVNFLLGLQSLSGILIMPYVQNYFRMTTRRIVRAASALFFYGFVICAVVIPVILFILDRFYRLPAEPLHGALALVYAWPVYYYTLFSYILLKRKHDKEVFIINISSVIINVGLALIMLPHYGVAGGIAAASISHLFLMVVYHIRVRKLLKADRTTESENVLTVDSGL